MLKLLIFLSLIAGNSSYDTTKTDRKAIFCLAKAVYHESRGEPIKGQMAVAHVVINRSASPYYPKHICNVIYQPKQFTDILVSKPDYNSRSWETAVEVASFAYLGITEDPTNGATHYYAHEKVEPYWAVSFELANVIGGHTFMK